MDRVVVARAAAVERQLVTADRRQDERRQRVADLTSSNLGAVWRVTVAMVPASYFLAASGLRTTVMPFAVATGLPAWSFISVSETTNHSAPPFLS